MYTAPQDVRDLLGLTLEDATDDILEEFITKAQHVILHHIQIKVQEEPVVLDSSGTTFSVSHPFIADTNFDKVIDASDITVYGYSDSIESREILSVSTIWPDVGIVKLSSSAVSYQKVTVSYSYYTCAIDWNLVALATAYYAGMLWVARELFLVPDDYSIGNIRVRQRQPWDKLRNEFLKIVFHLTELPMDKVSYEKIMVSPRTTLRQRGPGTTYQQEDIGIGENVKDPECD